MTRFTQCSDDEHLRQLLEDATGESSRSDLIEHLEGCRSCAARLEQLAADDVFWETSAASLQTDQFDWAGDPESTIPLSPVLKSLLAPSEDPRSLGRIGRFEVLGVVGSGGMGTVLKARDVDIDRVVALKMPAAHLMDSPTALARIEREARSAATIRHPGIIEIYQVQRLRDIPYLVMPFHTGPSLTSRLDSGGPMNLLESIRVARQTAEALAAAHRHGVVHRDVKPGNILLGKGTERAVLTDFGIAKIQADTQVTATGVVVGTPAFLSPEQARGAEATPQSDLFSLGSVLWSMLAGRPPFVDLPTHAVVSSVAAGDLPRLSDFRRRLPQWVYELVDWLHQVDPSDRPASARACADVLSCCEQHLLDPANHALPMCVNPKQKPSRRAWKLLSIAAAITLVASISMQLWSNSRPRLKQTNTSAPDSGYRAAAVESLAVIVDEMDREMSDVIRHLERMTDAKQDESELTSESDTVPEIEG